MQRAEALRRDFHPRLGLGQATDVSDDRKVEAMGRLEAMLGRSLLDTPDVGEDEAPAPEPVHREALDPRARSVLR